ncbi:MAG TPA: transketolase C-terminal domain-containing protein, partial [Candidatus Paceibacterota bacterium]|nr:transketolase C-terminal domain-containing protein [Candidatus Paceibacterota bacterium]
MLAKNAKLNPKLFDRDVERMGPRDGFSVGLVLAADQNANVVGLCADLRESVRMEAFAQKYPERYIEVGVAEQNMAGVAAGLGVSGKIPYIASFATFSPGRNWEQLRTTVAYNDSNVKIAGHHAGLATGEDGATHQALEDIAIMRALPNMRIVVPCDAMEAKKATAAAAKIWGPMYLRFSRAPVPVMTTEATKFVPGKAYLMWETPKPQAVIIGAGAILFEALQAARELEKEKMNVLVLNSHTIEPL